MAQLFQKIKAAEFELPSFFSPEGAYHIHTYIHTYIYTFKHTYNFYHNNALYNTIAKDLISRILVPNPQDRARIPDLKKHEWYAHPNLATHFFSITIVCMYVCRYTKKGTEPPYTAATTLANSAKAQSDSDVHPHTYILIIFFYVRTYILIQYIYTYL